MSYFGEKIVRKIFAKKLPDVGFLEHPVNFLGANEM
jgi:hypothetical protein